MQLAFESPAVIVLLDLLDLLVPAGGTPEEDERHVAGLARLQRVPHDCRRSGI